MLCIHHSIFHVRTNTVSYYFRTPDTAARPRRSAPRTRHRGRNRDAARTAPGAARHGRGSDIIYAHVSRPSASFSCLRR